MIKLNRTVIALGLAATSAIATASPALTGYTSPYNTYIENKLSYDKMVDKASNLNEIGKVRAVNYHFNQYTYSRDIENWGRSDYWATIDELFYKGKGDCEDIATAKYFTLLKLDVDPGKLSLNYSMHNVLKVPHLTVNYSSDSGVVVLDNFNDSLTLKSEAKHLTEVYQFNTSSAWIEKNGASIKIPTTNSRWETLVARHYESEPTYAVSMALN